MHLPNHDGSNVKPITHHVRHVIQTLPPYLTRTAAQKTSLLQIDGFVAYADPRHMVTTYVQQYAPHSRDLGFRALFPKIRKRQTEISQSQAIALWSVAHRQKVGRACTSFFSASRRPLEGQETLQKLSARQTDEEHVC